MERIQKPVSTWIVELTDEEYDAILTAFRTTRDQYDTGHMDNKEMHDYYDRLQLRWERMGEE